MKKAIQWILSLVLVFVAFGHISLTLNGDTFIITAGGSLIVKLILIIFAILISPPGYAYVRRYWGQKKIS